MNTLVRWAWFLTVGWVIGLFWFVASICAMISIVGFPLGVWMANRTWAVATLRTKNL